MRVSSSKVDGEGKSCPLWSAIKCPASGEAVRSRPADHDTQLLCGTHACCGRGWRGDKVRVVWRQGRTWNPIDVQNKCLPVTLKGPLTRVILNVYSHSSCTLNSIKLPSVHRYFLFALMC